MIVKDLDTLSYHRVVFRCDNEPSILALLWAVKLTWTGDVAQETPAEGDPQSNGAAESSVNVVKKCQIDQTDSGVSLLRRSRTTETSTRSFFALAAKERKDEESQPKRHRPEGERGQPLAPSASGVQSNYQEGGSSCSGSALPRPPAPPPLEPPPLAKRSLEQETDMTDATVEQQGESMRRKEHPEAPQAAESSGSSSGSDSTTDT